MIFLTFSSFLVAQTEYCGFPSDVPYGGYQQAMSQLSSAGNVANSTHFEIPVHLNILVDETGQPSEYTIDEIVLSANDKILASNFAFTENYSFFLCSYTTFTAPDGETTIEFGTLDLDNYANLSQAENTVNLYLGDVSGTLQGGGIVGGFTSLPWTDPINAIALNYLFNSTIFIHEMGHYLGLLHTFNGVPYDPTLPCEINGDYICETPADPGTDDCPDTNECDDSITCTFLFGLFGPWDYNSDRSNFMSYFPCRTDFVDEQQQVMKTVLFHHPNRNFLVQTPNTTCVTVPYQEGFVVRPKQLSDGSEQLTPFPGVEVRFFEQNQSSAFCSPSTGMDELFSVLPCNITSNTGSISYYPERENIDHEGYTYMNGVTTFDLIKINKHILGVEPFTTPFQMIAADVNNSGTITTLDNIRIRRLILGIITEFQEVDIWRFVPAVAEEDDVFWTNFNNDPFTASWTDPGNISRSYNGANSYFDDVNVNTMNNLVLDEKIWSFYAVKPGDVNGSAVTDIDGFNDEEETFLFTERPINPTDMLRFLLLILFFIFMDSLYAQSPLPPIGSQPLWRVGWTALGGSSGIDEFTYGQQYLRCSKKYVAVLLNGEELLYLRLTADRAYYIMDLQICEDERLLYDYSTSEEIEVTARSFFSPIFDTLSVQFGDDSYTDPLLGNEGVVVHYDNTMDFYPSNSMSFWLRGVGDLIHPFYPLFNNFQPTQEIFYRLHSLEVNHLTWFCATIVNPVCSPNQVIYVDGDNTTGMNDGSSWLNAYHRLETALDDADFGDVLWVADGTYSLPMDSERYESFVLRNGISMYGGFQGNENNFLERNPELYNTILSGDIGILADSTDNTNHVLRIQDAYDYVVIDGISINDGNSRGGTLGFPFSEKGGGILIYAAVPTDENADIVINNCQIQSNSAKEGGGIAFHQNYDVRTNLFITSTNIQQNYADQVGGGLSIPEFTPAMIDLKLHETNFVGNICKAGFGGGISDFTGGSWTINNTLFEDNKVTNGDGGAFNVYLRGVGKSISLLCTDFINNTAVSSGGAIQILHELGSIDLQMSIEGCNFNENRSYAAAGGALMLASFAPMNLDLSVKNSHFFNNRSSDRGGAIILRVEGGGGDGLIDVDGCVFSENRSGDYIGGAIRFYVETPNDGIITTKTLRSRIQNSLFFDNRNAISHASVAGESCIRDTIINCTFVNNGLIPFSKNYTPAFNGIDYCNEMYLKNCVIWEPNLPLWQLFYNGDPNILNMYHYELDHCIVSTEVCDLPGGEEACEQNVNYFNIYPVFRDTAHHDYTLSGCSPAINAGGFYAATGSTDLNGNARIQEDIIDLGSYEGQTLQTNIDSLNTALACYGDQTGMIDISLTNSVMPISYSLQKEEGLVLTANEGTFNNLDAGQYAVYMEDAVGCLDTFAFSVDEPLPLLMGITTTDYFSIEEAGTITVDSITGGIAPYELFFEDVLTESNNFLDLSPGVYSLNVLDSLGCNLDTTVIIDLIDATTSLVEPLATEICIYPNPVVNKNVAQLVLKNILPYEVIAYIATLEGKITAIYELSASGGSITSPDEKGIYIVIVATNSGLILKRIKWVVQ